MFYDLIVYFLDYFLCSQSLFQYIFFAYLAKLFCFIFKYTSYKILNIVRKFLVLLGTIWHIHLGSTGDRFYFYAECFPKYYHGCHVYWCLHFTDMYEPINTRIVADASTLLSLAELFFKPSELGSGYYLYERISGNF